MTDQPSVVTPTWPTCDSKGCIGIRAQGAEACLAHLGPEARSGFLAAIRPGADIDLRGIRVDPALLNQVLAAMQHTDGSRTLGDAQFNEAQFNEGVGFDRVIFAGYAEFDGAQFHGAVGFREAQFGGEARFADVRFGRAAWFRDTKFDQNAWFGGAQFPGAASFEGAQFGGDSWFGDAEFGGAVWFAGATFNGPASFHRAHFVEGAEFNEARFSDEAWFGRARFSDDAGFRKVRFDGDVQFPGAQFDGDAVFAETQFGRHTEFSGAQVSGDVWFGDAQFRRTRFLGPLLATTVVLDGAAFDEAITLEMTSSILSCIGTKFDETATLRLRYAEVAVDEAVFAKPSTIAFAADAFGSRAEGKVEMPDEGQLVRAAGDRSPRPRLLSLRGVDGTGVTLSDLDLSACRFQGSHNLDRVHIEGRSPFAATPTGWKFGRVSGLRLPLWRWTRRWTLAEEHHWRANRYPPVATNGRPHPKREGWYPPAVQPPQWYVDATGHEMQPLPPGRVASWYRALRKSWEDSKDEPGAADFYYGEMEMRRLGPATPWGERFILWLYWLVSGYGLRGLRALAWLAVVVVSLGILFELVGFARHPSPPTVWGSLLYAARSTLSIADPEAQLTGWGKLLQLVLRLAGPVLLGLALLAVRNRVKR
jgi:uncharacterized protein YjbI with pentapeptide repeats